MFAKFVYITVKRKFVFGYKFKKNIISVSNAIRLLRFSVLTLEYKL